MSKRRILYVEDNEYNRKIVRQLLSRSPCRLIEANDGDAGVALARSELPDLILMDVQLPKMSGLDATRLLTTEAATRHIPIIVITSYALSGDREKAMQAGASNYLAKPYSPSELLAMVKHYLPDL
jgi:two-component system cell cycle response regulator DivK